MMNALQVCGLLWFAWWIYWTISARFVQKTRSSESFLPRLSHLIPTALAFFLIFRWYHFSVFEGRAFYQDSAIAWVGPPLTLVGLLFAVWARIHLGRYWSAVITLKEGHRLIRTGPYRFVRHPIYTGFLSGALGAVIAAGTWDAALAMLILVVAYLIKMKREENLLTLQFGDEYRQFKRETPALFPLKKSSRADTF